MNSENINVLLADDDMEDCMFFKKALEELPLSTCLTTVHNGEQLMDYLYGNMACLPDVLFLDLSMPRKTGFECLSEIKEDHRLKSLFVVVFTTSFGRYVAFEQGLIDTLSKLGAQEFIKKLSDFGQLKKNIYDVLVLTVETRRTTSENPLIEKYFKPASDINL
jgi:CheY-like chemotaxis protein